MELDDLHGVVSAFGFKQMLNSTKVNKSKDNFIGYLHDLNVGFL